MTAERTAVVGPEHWLHTSAGARGESWGRLVALIDTEPTEEQFMVAEWAATNTCGQSSCRTRSGKSRPDEHRNMLTELISGNKDGWFELRSRLQGAGIPTQDRSYIGPSLTRKLTPGKEIDSHEDLDRDLADSAAAAGNRTNLPNLVESLRPNCVAMLVVLPAKHNRAALLGGLSKTIHERSSLASTSPLVIGIGTVVNSLQEVQRSIIEANQVAEVASSMSLHRQYYEISDVRLRGLLHYLLNDYRVQDFIGRELGP